MEEETKDYLLAQVEKETAKQNWQHDLDEILRGLGDKIVKDYERQYLEDGELDCDEYDEASDFVEEAVKQKIRDYIK
jgi:hypothetical protein